MKIAVTGHRPKELGFGERGGYAPFVRYRLLNLARAVVKRYDKAEHFITGMALGWDQAIAQACVDLSVPFLAAVPFEGQENAWNEQSQEYYRWLLERAVDVRYVCDPGYAAWKMHVRNEWMVDNCDFLIALYNGSPTGGTASCVAYAKEAKRPIVNCWNAWQQKFSKGEV